MLGSPKEKWYVSMGFIKRKKILYTCLAMPVLLFGLYILLSCRHSADSNLHCADMLMYEHPDSALSLKYDDKEIASKSLFFLRSEHLRKQRRGYAIIFLVGLFICMKGYLRYREYIHKKEYMRLKTQKNFEGQKPDLLLEFEKSRTASTESLEKREQTANEDFVRTIRQQYAEINSFCDEYYQSSFDKRNNEKAADKINSIVRSLTEKEGIEKVISYVDEKSDGLYSAFKREYFDMSEENFRLFLYLLLGFSARTISVILGLDLSVVYNRKSRLRAKVSKSSASRKDDYLRIF